MDIAWKDGKLTEAVIRSKLGRPCNIRYAQQVLKVETQPGGSCRLGPAFERL